MSIITSKFRLLRGYKPDILYVWWTFYMISEQSRIIMWVHTTLGLGDELAASKPRFGIKIFDLQLVVEPECETGGIKSEVERDARLVVSESSSEERVRLGIKVLLAKGRKGKPASWSRASRPSTKGKVFISMSVVEGEYLGARSMCKSHYYGRSVLMNKSFIGQMMCRNMFYKNL